VLLSACRATGGSGALARIGDVVHEGESVVLVRMLPPPAPAGSIALVVSGKDGKVELRIAEPKGSTGGTTAGSAGAGGLTIVHISRPGDEFRNLTLQDVTGDGAPEVVTSWIGGQLEVVEVLGRSSGASGASPSSPGASGTWTPLLQNGGQEVETRRRPDRTTAFWITSRTYEEAAGQPPVYQTTIYSWDGKQFREQNAGG
jgi:hypothetical protein